MKCRHIWHEVRTDPDYDYVLWQCAWCKGFRRNNETEVHYDEE